MGSPVRAVALELLMDVLAERRLISEVAPRRLKRLAPGDRAAAQRLALTTLRNLERADRMLGPFLQKKPPLRVHNILRLGVVEMCAEGAPAHAVVNAAVELARADRRRQNMAGLVNAVLRKVSPEKWAGLPVPKLPKWLRKVLVDDFGREAVLAMEAVQVETPPLDLTAKGDAAELAQRLGGEVLPTGSVRLHGRQQVSALPGFEAGAFWVQDAAAAIPACVLAAEPGEKVLDMCAAPGGKTMQLAAAGARVTALDISAGRLARVRENLERTGLSADIVEADALTYEGGPFDAILLDAPCTATGTIRRHPDLPFAKDAGDFPALFELQEYMIDRALALVKPGGRVVYCTCSLLIDEGEEQVRDALARHSGLCVETDALRVPGVEPDWIGPEGLRLRPDYWAERGGMDGFFVTQFRAPS